MELDRQIGAIIEAELKDTLPEKHAIMVSVSTGFKLFCILYLICCGQ